MSYNVHNCIGLDNVRDYNRIANIIKQAAPDVVALQELDSITQRNDGVYALKELETLTGMHGFFCLSHSFPGRQLRHRTAVQGAATELQEDSHART